MHENISYYECHCRGGELDGDERLYFRCQCFCAILQGQGQSKPIKMFYSTCSPKVVSQTNEWNSHLSFTSNEWIFIFLSNILLFILQAAELGMASAYYTYIFTNLVRHFHSSPPRHRVSLIRVSAVWQNEAQEMGIGKIKAEASKRGRVLRATGILIPIILSLERMGIWEV